jgi:hypothetical protein
VDREDVPGVDSSNETSNISSNTFSILRNSIYRMVREEFREQGIIAEQKAALEPRRDAACKELRASRAGAATDIEREFKGRLADARKLYGRDRPGAIRAALAWRREALKALAEKRRVARRKSPIDGGFEGFGPQPRAISPGRDRIFENNQICPTFRYGG